MLFLPMMAIKVVVLTIRIRKGSLKPISVVVKVRQGRKTSTLITGFEPFLTADAETIADELRKVCASATSGEL
jgi:translation initiation factor 2D